MYYLQNIIPANIVILYVLVVFNLSTNLISGLLITLRASMHIKLFHFYEPKVVHYNKYDGQSDGIIILSWNNIFPEEKDDEKKRFI